MTKTQFIAMLGGLALIAFLFLATTGLLVVVLARSRAADPARTLVNGRKVVNVCVCDPGKDWCENATVRLQDGLEVRDDGRAVILMFSRRDFNAFWRMRPGAGDLPAGAVAGEATGHLPDD